MTDFGLALSSEEHAPNDLVALAKRAEETGFEFAMISDHFHPWADVQGHSPFVWSVIGGIAEATARIRLGTGVTCPTIRIHPGDHRPGRRHLGRDDGGQVLSRARNRREPERARRR